MSNVQRHPERMPVERPLLRGVPVIRQAAQVFIDTMDWRPHHWCSPEREPSRVAWVEMVAYATMGYAGYPMTTTDMSDAAQVPHPSKVRVVDWMRAASAAELGRCMVTLEKAGRTQRVVVPGWQRQLWWWRT